MLALRWAVVPLAVASALAATWTYDAQEPLLWVPDLFVGLAAVLLAATTWRASPAASTVALLVAASWWVGTAWPEALYWHRAPLVHLVLSTPRAWPRTRVARAVVVAAYLAAPLTPLWDTQAAAVGVALIIGAAGAWEARARGRAHHLVAPGLLAVAVAGGTVVPWILGEGSAAAPTLVGYDALLVATLAVVAFEAHAPSQAALTDLAVELGPTPVRDTAALAERVRLEPGLTVDRRLQAALARAVRLEEANRRVQDEVRDAIAQVEHSRRRLVVSAATERAGLAQELTGTIAAPLHLLAERARGAGLPDAELARAGEGLAAAVRGLRPPSLDRGLRSALRDHPLVTRLGVDLVAADARCDQPVEDTLFAVASEGLANAARHAGRCRVAVRFQVDGPIARLTVTDSGVGGAVPGSGSGLTGLGDRVEALGGTLTVTSAPGEGTTLTARVPRAVPEGPPRPRSTADRPPGPGTAAPEWSGGATR